jgi:hypothetical protein
MHNQPARMRDLRCALSPDNCLELTVGGLLHEMSAGIIQGGNLRQRPTPIGLGACGANGDEIVLPVHYVKQTPALLAILDPLPHHPALGGGVPLGGVSWMKRR